MRLCHPAVFLVISFVSVIGCGESSSPQTVENNEIQAYIQNNPEMAARLEARQSPDLPDDE